MMNDDDPVVRSRELDRRILAIPESQIFTKRTVIAGFMVIVLLLICGFGYMYLTLRGITRDTNDAVTQEIPGLRRQVEDRDETIADQESVITQSTAAIVQLLDLLRANGVEPPRIIIQPPDD